MRQRLAIAASLLTPRELLVLDEPTNGLDPQGTREVRHLVASLAEDGATVLISSHLLSEVEQICTHLGIMSDGRLVAQGTVAELRGAGVTTVGVTTSRPSDAASRPRSARRHRRRGRRRTRCAATRDRSRPRRSWRRSSTPTFRVRGFAVTTPSLEDLFVSPDGGGLRCQRLSATTVARAVDRGGQPAAPSAWSSTAAPALRAAADRRPPAQPAGTARPRRGAGAPGDLGADLVQQRVRRRTGLPRLDHRRTACSCRSAALTVELGLFLPLAISMLAGDAVAGEANLGTLRYLLTVPVSRTRLLARQVRVARASARSGASLLVAVAGAIVGIALFGTGPLTTLSGSPAGLRLPRSGRVLLVRPLPERLASPPSAPSACSSPRSPSSRSPPRSPR